MPFAAPETQVLLGTLVPAAGVASATIALPPATTAIQIVTGAGATNVTVVGAETGADYYNGTPPSAGNVVALINFGVDPSITVTVTGSSSDSFVTTATLGFATAALSAGGGGSVLNGPTLRPFGASYTGTGGTMSVVCAAGDNLVVATQRFASAVALVPTATGLVFTQVSYAVAPNTNNTVALFTAPVATAGSYTVTIPGSGGSNAIAQSIGNLAGTIANVISGSGTTANGGALTENVTVPGKAAGVFVVGVDPNSNFECGITGVNGQATVNEYGSFRTLVFCFYANNPVAATPAMGIGYAINVNGYSMDVAYVGCSIA